MKSKKSRETKYNYKQTFKTLDDASIKIRKLKYIHVNNR